MERANEILRSGWSDRCRGEGRSSISEWNWDGGRDKREVDCKGSRMVSWIILQARAVARGFPFQVPT